MDASRRTRAEACLWHVEHRGWREAPRMCRRCAEPLEDAEALAARLRAIADGTPPPALPSTSAAAHEVTELATALKTLRALDPA